MMRRLALLLVSTACAAQDFSQRGFLENTTDFYPRVAPNDSGHVVSGMLLRYEAFYKASSHWHFACGIDARTDSHRDVERTFGLSWWDRSLRQPAFEVEHCSVTYTQGKLNFQVGKQSIRWGKADILNPTDRFAPQDYINVADPDYLGVTAARLTYGGQSNSIDAVFTPRLTPSRMPLIDQRWSVAPENVPIVDLGSHFPGGTQYGARFNHIGSADEFSLSFFDGYNHLPLINASIEPAPVPILEFLRFYPRIRTYGGDLAVPTRWLTFKSEAAYFTSTNVKADEYVLYVMQMERQAGEWFFVGGYAGEVVTEHRAIFDFDPERGLARAFLGRVGYNIGANRSIALKAVVRENGRASWTRAEYSQGLGQHLRATLSYNWLRGEPNDFLGQFYRNSFFSIVLRYSF